MKFSLNFVVGGVKKESRGLGIEDVFPRLYNQSSSFKWFFLSTMKSWH